MTTFGSKEPWMEPMNRFLLGNRGDFRQFVDSVCAIPADRPTPVVTPSYATPIQILGRLPPASREGFPSLPFLLDYPRGFANLIRIWLECAQPRLAELEEIDPVLQTFHETVLRLHERTKECLNRAEEAERPNPNLFDRWAGLVNSMEQNQAFYDENSSKPATSATEPVTIISSNHRNSVGYFGARPHVPRRSTDNTLEADEETPPSSSSATWELNRIPFNTPRWSDTRDSGTSSKNSSTYSLENSEATRSTRRQSVTKETSSSSKYRIFDFGQRRKAKDRDQSQNQHSSREEVRHERTP